MSIYGCGERSGREEGGGGRFLCDADRYLRQLGIWRGDHECKCKD